MNTNSKVIGLTRLGIKPKSAAPDADALTTQPYELFEVYSGQGFYSCAGRIGHVSPTARHRSDVSSHLCSQALTRGDDSRKLPQASVLCRSLW